MEKIGLSGRKHFSQEYLARAMANGFIEMTVPEKPNSRLQKFVREGVAFQKLFVRIQEMFRKISYLLSGFQVMM